MVGTIWFLITENPCANTLAIWKWSEDLSAREGVKAVCGQRHARELIVHWITAGSLHYPFATTSRPAAPPPASADAETCAASNQGCRLGELAIDRNEIIRVLHQNPMSLNAMLDELMIVLEEQSGVGEEDEVEEPALTLN